ncbi:MAG: hypothetical protein JXQ30_08745 [Spirochaetes bacterium]|nr:hypothetical protein [Spirochaetota bacterium]
MATQSAYGGLVELANRHCGKEYIGVVNTLVEDVPIIGDAVFTEANDQTSHHHTKTAILPIASRRGLNEGITPTRMVTKPMTEHMSRIEDHVNIDEYEVELASDMRQYRYDEDEGHLEGMKQRIGTDFWYGSHAVDIRAVDGLATRYAALAENVLNCGGTGEDLSSFWFIGHNKRGVFLVYPKNAKNLGIKRNDKGLILIRDSATGKQLFKWVTQFVFNFGTVVRDDRYVQRVCNIKTTGAENTLDIDLLIEAYENLPTTKGVVAYCNKKIKTQLNIAAANKPNVLWTGKDPFGKPQLYFYDIPVKKDGMILSTEDAVA